MFFRSRIDYWRKLRAEHGASPLDGLARCEKDARGNFTCVSSANRDSLIAEDTHAEPHLRLYIATIRDFWQDYEQRLLSAVSIVVVVDQSALVHTGKSGQQQPVKFALKSLAYRRAFQARLKFGEHQRKSLDEHRPVECSSDDAERLQFAERPVDCCP